MARKEWPLWAYTTVAIGIAVSCFICAVIIPCVGVGKRIMERKKQYIPMPAATGDPIGHGIIEDVVRIRHRLRLKEEGKLIDQHEFDTLRIYRGLKSIEWREPDDGSKALLMRDWATMWWEDGEIKVDYDRRR